MVMATIAVVNVCEDCAVDGTKAVCPGVRGGFQSKSVETHSSCLPLRLCALTVQGLDSSRASLQRQPSAGAATAPALSRAASVHEAPEAGAANAWPTTRFKH